MVTSPFRGAGQRHLPVAAQFRAAGGRSTLKYLRRCILAVVSRSVSTEDAPFAAFRGPRNELIDAGAGRVAAGLAVVGRVVV